MAEFEIRLTRRDGRTLTAGAIRGHIARLVALDEWLTMGKRYLPQSSMTRLPGGVPGTTLAELLWEGLAVREVVRLEVGFHHLTGRNLRVAATTHGHPASGT